jgi:hypothetical protein
MGLEQTCEVTYHGETASVKAHLDTASVQNRGPVRLNMPFGEMASIAADEHALTVGWRGEEIVLRFGAASAKWADRIRDPRSLLDKRGVKPEHVRGPAARPQGLKSRADKRSPPSETPFRRLRRRGTPGPAFPTTRPAQAGFVFQRGVLSPAKLSNRTVRAPGS